MNNTQHIQVWDIFVRLTHISFIVLLPLLYWTAHEGMMTIHQYLGIGLLFLVITRIIWGLCSRSYGRFGHFLHPPTVVLGYVTSLLKRQSTYYLSHNPAGGYMVVVLLTLLATQATLGLFSMDDILFEGPLVFLIDGELSERITQWHYRLFDFLLVAIGLHIVAVCWYQFFKRQALIQSMIHGRKALRNEAKDTIESAK